jgi:hypothetical protein
MNNTEKKLDALIDALGFDVEASTVSRELSNPYNSKIEVVTCTDYKLTKRNINNEPLNCHVACVPLPVQSDAWGGVINYCASHADDIEAGVGDFDMLQPIWEFMKGKGNE